MANENQLQTAKKSEIAKPTASQRFTDTVIKQFSGYVGGGIEVSEPQKRLIRGYFVTIDKALNAAEEERLRKNDNNKDHKYDNDLPVTWANVNMTTLALDLVSYAQMGLDMTKKNMLFPIPYKNKKNNNYDLTLMTGYNGIRYMAEKYAADPPKDVVVEIVHKNDIFSIFKKNGERSVESYNFEIPNPFDRGDVVGGFAYLVYDDSEKNKLIVMSKHDIDKRKPQYASANFWGGDATEYVDGKKTTVKKEGWYEEMCRKTLIREAYSAKYLPVDPSKVDDAFQAQKERELRYAQLEAQAAIAENMAHPEIIDIPVSPIDPTPTVMLDPATGALIEGDANGNNG